nr:hypothetical protein [Parvularcula sp. IMCC14364]
MAETFGTISCKPRNTEWTVLLLFVGKTNIAGYRSLSDERETKIAQVNAMPFSLIL